MADSETPPLPLEGDNQLPMETEETATETTPTDTDSDMNTALKISRQFMILLEDYRYLMSCYEHSCSCHVNFDYQYFSRKLEEKYSILTDISSSNSFLLNALDDNCDFGALNDLWAASKSSSSNEQDNHPKYIKRIQIQTHNHQPSTNNTDSEEQEENTNASVAKSESVNNDQNDVISQEMSAYRCTHKKCEYITFNQDDIYKHISNHDIYDTSKKVDKNSVIYVCEQCSKEFSAQKWLNNHIENVHSNVKLYACNAPGCTYKSKFRCVMDDHKRRHNSHREFKCIWEGCTSEFVTKRDMVAHVNFSHKGIKNFCCTWPNCNATFKDSNRLKHHYFTHTGERPYVCEVKGCTASFKQMPHLYKHRKIHLDIPWCIQLINSSKQNIHK